MRLMVFAVAGMIAFILAYGFGLGGTVACLLFLFIFFNGALDKVAQPLLKQLRS